MNLFYSFTMSVVVIVAAMNDWRMAAGLCMAQLCTHYIGQCIKEANNG